MKKFLMTLCLFTTLLARADGPIQNAQVMGVADVQKSVLSTTGNLTLSNACISSPASLANLFVGAYVYDNTNPTYIPALTTIAGLPGSCSAGQIQMSATAGDAATGDTLYFGGNPLTQVVSDNKVMVTANSINQTLNSAITAGLIGGGGGGGGIQINVLNGNAEIGNTSSWSPDVGGDFSASNASPLDGAYSFIFLPVSANEKTVHSLLTVPIGLQGRSCVANMVYKTTEAVHNYVFIVKDGSGNVLNSEVLPPSGTLSAFANPLTFICPSTTVQVGIYAPAGGAPSASIKFDDVLVGQNVLPQVSQAQLVGTMTITGCSTSFAYPVSSGYQDATPSSGCTYTGTGGLTAPASQLVGFNAALPQGEYQVVVNASPISNGSSQEFLQLSSASVFSREQITAGNPTSGGMGWLGTEVFTFPLSSAQVAADYTVKGNWQSGGTFDFADYIAVPIVISVYRFPTQSQASATIGTSSENWTGYHSRANCAEFSAPGGAGPSQLSSGVSTSTCNVTTRTGTNFGTVTTTGSPNATAGIIFTPNSTGLFRVCATSSVFVSSSGGESIQLDLTDGASTIYSSTGFGMGSAGVNLPFHLCADVPIASLGASAQVQLQGGNNGSGNMGIGESAAGITEASIEWSILNISQPIPAPVIVGGVSSASSGVESLNRLQIAGGCTSSPCTITSQSGSWVSSVTRTGLGEYSINLNPGAFSSAPTCTFSTFDNGPVFAVGNGLPSTSTILLSTQSSSVSVDTVNGIGVICMGPH